MASFRIAQLRLPARAKVIDRVGLAFTVVQLAGSVCLLGVVVLAIAHRL
jgi:hypothetical protein